MDKKYLVIDYSDNDLVIYHCEGMRFMLKTIQDFDFESIKVYEISKEIKLKEQSRIILDENN